MAGGQHVIARGNGGLGYARPDRGGSYRNMVWTAANVAKAAYNASQHPGVRQAFNYIGNPTSRSHARDFRQRPYPARPAGTGQAPFQAGRRGGTTGPGRSGGFLKTRKVRKTKARKLSNKGIDYCKEVGGRTTSANCVYIGHNTCPNQLILSCAWRAMFKHFFLEAGADISDLTESLGFPSGSQLIVNYSQSTGGPLLVETITVTDDAAFINGFVSWAMDITRPWNAPSGALNLKIQVQFESMRTIIASPEISTLHSHNMSMRFARVAFAVKSALKIQNRTIGAIDNGVEADDVENCPLFGVSYEGKGSGTYTNHKRFSTPNANVNLWAHVDKGTILAEQPVNGFEEPMEPNMMNMVTREGKIKVEPGEIKTSVLTWNSSMFFTDLYDKMKYRNTDLSGTTAHKVGKFRIFAIEKMLQASATESAISTGYEHNIDIACNVSFKRSYRSVKFFEEVRGQNI